jgi:multiple sugar transport system permease protein
VKRSLLREIVEQRAAYLFIAPATTLFLVFLIYPAVRTLYISFYDWQLRGESDFIGLENYAGAFSSNLFYQTFGTTILYTVSVTCLAMLLGFVAAYLVNDLQGWWKVFVRSAIFMPSIASLIVTAFIWRSFLEPDGLFQRMTEFFGIPSVSWLGSPDLAPLAVIVMTAWQQIGYTMVFFLAGLQNIPSMFYEAAEVDGADSWVKLRAITLPLLRRTTLFVLVITSLTNFKIFEQVFALTGGGPANATQSLMVYIYNSAFRHTRYGPAAAMAIIFSLVAMGVALAQVYMLRAKHEY